MKYKFLINLAVSHYLEPAIKMGSKPEKIVLIVKKTILGLVFHFKGMFIDILKIINCTDE